MDCKKIYLHRRCPTSSNAMKLAKYLTVVFLLTFISPTTTFSQFDRLLFNKIDVETGLSQNMITSIFQDYLGFIWIGTDDGLNRYDGYNVKVYRNNKSDSSSISDNWIVQLIEDKAKNLWVLTHQGVNKFDRRNDSFIRYTFNKNDTNSIQSNTMQRGFVDSRGELWFSNVKGFVKYNYETNSFTRYGKSNTESYKQDSLHTYFVEDSKGTIWVTSSYGVSSINTHTNHYKYYPIIKDKSAMVTGFNIDNNDEVWVHINRECELFKYDKLTDEFKQILIALRQKQTTYESYPKIIFGLDDTFWYSNSTGLIKHNKNTGELTNFNGIDAPKMSNDILIIDHKLFMATNYGLYTFDTLTNKFQKYIKNDFDQYGLSENQLVSLYNDNKGDIWIRSNRGGVNKIVNPLFKPIRGISTFLNSKKIYTIYKDREDNIWFTTLQDGLNMLNAKTGEIEHFIPSKNNPYSIQSGFLSLIYQDKYGVYWVGSRDKGIRTLDIKTKRFNRVIGTTPSLDNHATRSFLEDSEGTLWIGTRGGGLNKYNRLKQKFETVLYDTDSPLKNQIITIFEDSKKNFWLGTDAGLILFNRKNLKMEIVQFYAKESGPMGSNSIFGIHEDKNNVLWLTTYGGGLISFNPINKATKIYTESDGLLNNYVYNITVDDSGYFWLNTHKGLSRFDQRTQKFINFTKEDGLPSNELNADGAIKYKNGMLIFGSANGAFFFDPLKISNNEDYNIAFTSFRKFNNQTKLVPDISVADEIILNYNDYVFSIEYAALEYNEPNRVRYAYRLEGFEGKWNFVGTKREATYTNLDPGTYHFHVIASNGIDEWNYNSGKKIKIIIQPAWWQTWWFKFFVLLIIVSSIWLIVHFRIRNVKKIEAAKVEEQQKSFIAIEKTRKKEEEKRIASERSLKETISQNLHDGVLTELASIPIKCTVLLSDKTPNSDKKKIVSTIGNIADSVNRLVREEMWFLNYKNESSQNLIKRFEYFIGNILEDISYKLNINDDAFDSPYLTMNIKQQIFLIYKEVLHNIYKHSKAKNVEAKIYRNNNTITMSITDDGVGFDTSISTSGNGLQNIQKRSTKINGEIILSSRPGKGTSFTLIVRLVNIAYE
ncbi:MAG TPA: two-component regulator propeller domain-containing protein [Ignavibacteriaceae bacterium]|nr:two-component regulator propeller domain-containing protein [Ignavibacteriaceae bacterium]